MPQPILPAVNGTEQRLDAVIEELRAIRARIEAGNPHPAAVDPGKVELKEPAKPKKEK